ncbi:MAG: hypothetical protein JJE04_14010 [Acidobacteriia bacterium]|nr:hypothetical protein [Terriglobia bacterium]
MNCWTLAESESIPLWKIYASFNAGIVIQSTVDKFAKAVRFPEAYPAHTTGRVEYYDGLPPRVFDYNISVEFSWKKKFVINLQKRSCFDFEKEWRAIVVGNGHDKGRGVQVPVVLGDLIEAVVVSPAASASFFASVVALVQRFGLNVTARQSEFARSRPRQTRPVS